MSAAAARDVSRIRALYKAILKLHRGFPQEFRRLGNDYVKSEFRLLKNLGAKETGIFLNEWAKYYVILAKQMRTGKPNNLGENISQEFLDCFNKEQLVQLYKLFKESRKPIEVEGDKEK